MQNLPFTGMVLFFFLFLFFSFFKPALGTSQSPKVHRLTFSIVHSMGLEKCITTFTHYCNTIQSVFTALKVPCPLPIHSSLPTLAATDPFTVSIFFLFPECHIIGYIQYAAFLGWLLSLVMQHAFRFLHIFL